MPTNHPYTLTSAEMRGINRSAVLDIIRRESPISRTLIGQKLEISLATVMRIVDELTAEGLVRPEGSTEWSGGRRRALIEFNADGEVVIGVDMGRTKMFGAVCNLGGAVLAEIELSRHDTTGEQSYELLVALIEALLASPKIGGRKVRGIGVGVPGVTRHAQGVVAWSPSLRWRDFPLKARLAAAFNFPITVENGVHLAALGEQWFGAGQNTQNIALIAVGDGIGAGVVIDGALYRGAQEAAGAIGALLPGREFLGRRSAEPGALEAVVSGAGIAARAREALQGQRDPAELAALLAEDVFEAARRRDPWAEAVIAGAVDYLAMAIASLAACFDPDVIILGGGVARSSDLLLKPILARLEGALPTLPRLVVSPLDRRAAVLGAVASILHQTADFYVVHKLS